MASPGAPYQGPLPAPPALASPPPPAAPAAPPPPAADSRLPYPPPPGLSGPAPQSAPPGSWGAGPRAALPPAGPPGAQPEQPAMSDTQRMLAPQGLFSSSQPKPFDWQQPWSVPAAAAQQPGQQDPAATQRDLAGPPQGMAATLPQGMDAAPSALPAPPAPYPPQPGGPYPPQPGGPYPGPGQYPPGGGFPPGAGFPPGGYPPQPQPGGGYGPPPGAGYPYGPGQYPPGGQFGLGGPGYPGGPAGQRPWDKVAARLRLPKGPLGPAIVAAALVLVIVGAVALAIPGGSGTPSALGTGAATPGTSGSASPATSAANAAERQAAGRLSALLSQSAADHSDVNAAYGNVQACGKNLTKDARVFSKSAQSRRTLLAKLAQLPGRSALNAVMLADLTKGWQASARVDGYLAKWAAAAATHCHKGNVKDPNYLASFKYDGPASQGKAAFARLWNQVARKYNLPAVQADTL